MLTNKKLLALCLFQYILILCFHIVYSLIYCTEDQTRKVGLWSAGILFLLLIVLSIFQKKSDVVIYSTMAMVLVTVSYVGYILHTLAFGILIFFMAGVITGVFINKRYIMVWWISSTVVCELYLLFWPEIIKEMVSSLFLYYGYLLIYIIGGVNLFILVSTAEKSFGALKNSNELKDKEKTLKSIFWANVSNEIRTPMNVINGMSSLLKNESLSVRSKEYTEQIENASGMLINIVNDTLELSTIESGTYIPQKVPYDFYDAVHTAIMISSVTLQSKSVSLVYCINPKVPSVLNGDGEYICKFLTKLLNNAAFLTEHGEIRLEVDIDPQFSNDNKVMLDIKVFDSGKPFDFGNADNVFIGFENNSTGKTTEQESIGLSFKLCKSMIEILGGSINVRNDLGKGNCFVVRIMQDVGSEASFSLLRSKDDLDGKNKLMSSGAKVMVIDDTPTNLKLISGMIKLHGIEPDLAQSGREGIKMMENKKYDLVFIDYMMPEMNGIETLKQIKLRGTVENFEKVKTIALTSKSLLKDKERFMDLGFDDFISKPIDDRELENMLVKYLIKE